MTKGVLIRREGCMWNAEVCDLTFEQFSEKLQAFAAEEHAPHGACPWILGRMVGGHPVDIWYDENFLSYQPVPSGVPNKGADELLMGMLFITGGDYETGECVSLSDDVIKDVLAAYKVPDMPTVDRWNKVAPGLGFYMMGFKLIHYDY